MANTYEYFKEIMKPRYGFLNMRKRQYDDPILASRLRAINFDSFTKEQIEEVLRTLQEKNDNLLHEIQINTMNPIMNGEIDLSAYPFSKEEITKLFMYSDDYNTIPEYAKTNNEEIANEFLRKGNPFELRSEIIRCCPSLKDEANRKACDEVLRNYASYEGRLGDFQTTFVEYLKENRNDSNKFLEMLLANNFDLTPYYELYAWYDTFKSKYYLNNPDKINKENYEEIPGEAMGNVLNKYLDGNFDSEIVNNMFLKSAFLSDEIKAKVVKLYTEKKLSLRKEAIAKVIVDYPVEFLNTDFNNLSILVECYQKQNHQRIKDFSDFIKIMIEHRAILDISFAKAFISELVTPGNGEIGNILRSALESNIIDGNFLSALTRNINNYNVEIVKILYDYFKKNNIDVDEKFLMIINQNNFDINKTDLNEDIYFNVSDVNRKEILEFIAKLKENNYQKTVFLTIDEVDRDYIMQVNGILPNQIKIGPQRHQELKNGPSFYTVSEILEKDRILQFQADSTKPVQSKSGEKKELSPFEKFIACYQMTTRFWEYTNEDNSETQENYHVSRSVYEFIDSKDPRIVCVGYSNLLVEYLDRMGLRGSAERIELRPADGTHIGHAVVAIHIDDPKYGLNGTYISDPTGDAIQDMSDTYSSGYKNMLIPIEKYLKDNPKYKLDSKSAEYPLMTNKDAYAKTRVDKKQIIYGLLSVRHFLNKNDEMVAENKIGENGYTEKEFNDIATSNTYLASEMLNEENYINSFLNLPVSKMVDEIDNIPSSRYITDEIRWKLVYALSVQINYIDIPYGYNKAVISFEPDFNVSDENIAMIRSTFTNCRIVEQDNGSYAIEYDIDPNKTMYENIAEIKKKHELNMNMFNNYMKPDGNHI